MENKTKEELYNVLQNGSADEKEEALRVLKYQDKKIRENCIRGAAVAIIMRNLSHGMGVNVKVKH